LFIKNVKYSERGKNYYSRDSSGKNIEFYDSNTMSKFIVYVLVHNKM